MADGTRDVDEAVEARADTPVADSGDAAGVDPAAERTAQRMAPPAPVLLTPGARAVAGLVLAGLSVMGTGPAQEIASAVTFPAASKHFYAITGGIQAGLAVVAVMLATALLRVPDVTEPGVADAEGQATPPSVAGGWVLAVARAATIVGAIGFALNVVSVVVALA